MEFCNAFLHFSDFLGSAEVAQSELRDLCSHENISGFDVAVNEAELMQVLNGVADWGGNLRQHFRQDRIEVLAEHSGLFFGIIFFLSLWQNKMRELEKRSYYG